jgi:hypothetical protein
MDFGVCFFPDAESGSSDSGSDGEDADQVPESAPATKSPEPAAAAHVAGQSQNADDVIPEGEDFAFLATVFDQSLGGMHCLFFGYCALLSYWLPLVAK